jgi:uncharacterized protein YndB with AHSA1/START domain
MSTDTKAASAANELSFTRILDAPREKLFRCWTEPELLKPWFCPKPWGVSHAEIDARTGGSSYIVMNGPNGEVVPNRGIYLEVVKNERIVFSNAFTDGWHPQSIGNPGFMFVGVVNFEDAGAGKTRYTAAVRHWSEEDCKTHEKMGFYEGWGAATDQLVAFAKTI